MTKVAVFYVVGHLRVCGPNLQLLYLLSNLDLDNFKPVVFVTSNSRCAIIERKLQEMGVRIFFTNVSKLTSIFYCALSLRKIQRGFKKIVIHPYGLRSDMICFLSYSRPRLGSVRNNILFNYQQRLGFKFGWIITAVNLFLLRRTDVIVACGRSIKENLLTLGVEACYVRNAIDSRLYRELMCSNDFTDKAIKSRKKFLTVSSTIPGKNIEYLLRIFARSDCSERELNIIGPVEQRLVEEFRSFQTIKFLGHIEHPGDALLHADYFISASTHEGIPNAVLESLSMGTPVVLSDIPAHLEIISAAKEIVGLTFRNNSSELLDVLRQIEEMDYTLLCSNARKSVKKYFTASKMARSYEGLYFSMVNG